MHNAQRCDYISCAVHAVLLNNAARITAYTSETRQKYIYECMRAKAIRLIKMLIFTENKVRAAKGQPACQAGLTGRRSGLTCQARPRPLHAHDTCMQYMTTIFVLIQTKLTC